MHSSTVTESSETECFEMLLFWDVCWGAEGAVCTLAIMRKPRTVPLRDSPGTPPPILRSRSFDERLICFYAMALGVIDLRRRPQRHHCQRIPRARQQVPWGVEQAASYVT